MSLIGVSALPALAQTPPSNFDIENYQGLFQAVLQRDSKKLAQQIKLTPDIDQRDSYGRTALHVATYFANHEAMNLLQKAGADANALEHDCH